ncbi:MAG: class I tRNA ligase family protein, partial [Actinomycetota bacterium]|nr:class I tRNA ligase family protein [Actinomycetota bacterium]
MSKSKGNVVTPMGLLDEYSADAVRYWAASGRPGTDTAFDVGQMKIGRRLAIKILNASKFVLGFDAGFNDAAITADLDRALLAQLAGVVEQATAAFEDYNYARALELTESFFWNFTDDYVELVKERAYGGQGEEAAASAKATLAVTLDAILKLFAPFLPFVTEEVWSWWQEGSIHRSTWPDASHLHSLAHGADPALISEIANALSQVRKAKSEAKVSMRAVVESANISASENQLARLQGAVADFKAAGSIGELTFSTGESIEVEVVLAPISV